MSPSIGVTLRGTGTCMPARVIANEHFEKTLDTSNEWILSRTGIRERRIAGPEDTSASLGLKAAQQALDAAELTAHDLDLIICATITPEMIFPSTACFIQAGLGCRFIGAFDILAACSGFLYSLAVGSQFIRTGAYRNVLVVGTETLSRVTDFTDRGSCILFGDGAGAAILSATNDASRGLKYFRLYADGSRHDLLKLPGGGSRYPTSAESLASKQHYMKVNGREVYKFAVSHMQSLIRDAMADCHLQPGDVDLIIPHQVNLRIINSAIEHLGFPADKVMINLDRYGNTSSASVPVALDEAIRTGRAKPGDNVILVAFGGGLTWASVVLTL